MIKIKLLYLCSLFFLLSCNLATDINSETTTIVAGDSKITGRIITPHGQKKDSIMVTITVVYPITGEIIRQEILADQSGKFSLDFDVETETTLLGYAYGQHPQAVT